MTLRQIHEQRRLEQVAKMNEATKRKEVLADSGRHSKGQRVDQTLPVDSNITGSAAASTDSIGQTAKDSIPPHASAEDEEK